MEIKTRKRPNIANETNNDKKQRKRASTRSTHEVVSIATDSDTFSESSEMAGLNEDKIENEKINATLIEKAKQQLEHNEKLSAENERLHDELQQLKLAFAQRESQLQVIFNAN